MKIVFLLFALVLFAANASAQQTVARSVEGWQQAERDGTPALRAIRT